MAFKFSSLMSKRSPTLVGLDISTSGVKVVVLEGTASKPVVRAYAIVPLNRGDLNNGIIQKAESVTRAVSAALIAARIKIKNVALAMPSQTAITSTLSYPKGFKAQELEQYVESDAANQLPFPIDEVRLDFCRTGATLPNGEEEVLLVAAKREATDARLEAVEHAGLTPKVLDIESLCTERAITQLSKTLPKSGKGLLVALIDIGSDTLTLTVVRDKKVVFERDQPFGGYRLTQDIAKKFNLTPEEAERKKRLSDLPPEYPQTLLKPFLHSAGEAASRALQLFYTSTPYSRVDHVYLAGGSALLPGIVEAVIQYTDSPVELVKFSGVFALARSVSQRQFDRDSPMLGVALGLAIRSFDSATAA